MAFTIDGEARMSGVIYLPAFDALYHAVKGGGAFLNGERYNSIDISHALINTGDTSKYMPEWYDAQTGAVLRLNREALRVRCFGSGEPYKFGDVPVIGAVNRALALRISEIVRG